MVILGIDPGLANTGWGVVERTGSRFGCVAYGCVETTPATLLPDRLAEIHDALRWVVNRYEPYTCAIENVYFSTNVRTAFATGQARGVALLATRGLPAGTAEYGPGEVKLAIVGTGSAHKRQVQYMVRSILGLTETPAPHHAADALALAICHANTRRGLVTEDAVR